MFLTPKTKFINNNFHILIILKIRMNKWYLIHHFNDFYFYFQTIKGKKF